eukprot:gene13618-17383_t
MDGLLIDSERPIMAAWMAAARTLDVELSHAQYLQVVGLATAESEIILSGLLGGQAAFRHTLEHVRQALALERSDGTPLFPLSFDPMLYLVALLVATVTGLLAAYAPARRAARLDPVVAIRG